MGRRGGGWVGLQLLLIGALVAAGVRGRGDVEGPLLTVAVVTGTILIVIGTILIFSGIRQLQSIDQPYAKAGRGWANSSRTASTRTSAIRFISG